MVLNNFWSFDRIFYLLQNGTSDVAEASQADRTAIGHVFSSTTIRTYTHATRQKQDEAAATMGRFMEQVM